MNKDEQQQQTNRRTTKQRVFYLSYNAAMVDSAVYILYSGRCIRNILNYAQPSFLLIYWWLVLLLDAAACMCMPGKLQQQNAVTPTLYLNYIDIK